MRRRFEKYLVDGELIGVSKLGSKEVFMYIKLTGVDFPRELSSTTDAEAVHDGASQGQNAADWQSEKGIRLKCPQFDHGKTLPGPFVM